MKNSLGKSKAALKLEAILNRNPSARRKVASLLSKYTHQLLMITGAKDTETVRTCMELLRDYNLRRIDVKHFSTESESTEIRSLTKNLVIARYRAFRRGFDAVAPILEAQALKRKCLTSQKKKL